MGQGFETSYLMTIGADFAIKRIDEKVLQIWDLAGQPGFKSIRKDYYKGAHGLIMVFDITRRETVLHISNWLQEVYNATNANLPMVLVGNKADLRTESDDSLQKGQGLELSKLLSEQSALDIKYLESSALTGLNIDLLFKQIVDEIENFQATLEGK